MINDATLDWTVLRRTECARPVLSGRPSMARMTFDLAAAPS
jgi:hypothetical protein